MDLKNLILKIKYKLFRKSCKKLNLSNRKLIFEDTFENFNNFNIKDREFYNDNSVWFIKDAISLSNEGLVIKCKKDLSIHQSWQGTRRTMWASGMVDTKGKVEFSNGLWVITAKLNGGWPAAWLLKNDYIPNGYTKPTILPEIDIVETINSYFRHTIHWGYTNDSSYRRVETGSSICKWDNKFHTFAVDILKDGYDFYIDEFLTASFRDTNPEFVTDNANFLLLNGANDKDSNDESDIIFKSIKFYKNE